MTLCNRIVRMRLLNIAWAMLMIVSLAGVALAQLPSHGPTKGYLLITGGATGQADFRRFIEMSGGKNARIVVIPTASLTKPTEQAHLQEQYCGPKSPFAAVSCTVLHTTDRTIADSADFVAPLTTATHVDTRGRQYDLAPVIKLHPDLLGLGLDQNASITVHGDKLTVNGPMRVAVWDGKDHDGKGSYYLRTGDQLNTATRVATLAPHPAETTDK
jgi:cyanophycinase-like exopeptidase